MIKTVGELKRMLEKIPDDMEIEVYNGRGEDLIQWADIVQCDDLDCPDCGGDGTCIPPKFVISTD